MSLGSFGDRKNGRGETVNSFSSRAAIFSGDETSGGRWGYPPVCEK